MEIMSILSIPSIDVKLPVYHGLDANSLQVGVGHYPGSSLPVGGIGTHCILTGHSGLPSSRLLTDMDQLDIGSKFYLTTMDQTLCYEVYDIQVVLPEEVNHLLLDKDKDLCTLVTCTPYGINSHQLIITGKRIADDKPVVSNEKEINKSILLLCIAIIGISLVLFIINIYKAVSL